MGSLAVCMDNILEHCKSQEFRLMINVYISKLGDRKDTVVGIGDLGEMVDKNVFAN